MLPYGPSPGLKADECLWDDRVLKGNLHIDVGNMINSKAAPNLTKDTAFRSMTTGDDDDLENVECQQVHRPYTYSSKWLKPMD